MKMSTYCTDNTACISWDTGSNSFQDNQTAVLLPYIIKVNNDQNEAKNRIEKLRRQIEELRYRYHVLDDPKTTDDVSDS